LTTEPFITSTQQLCSHTRDR